MVDFEKHREESLANMYRTGGSAAGGLTVRDYFAAKAMQGMIAVVPKTVQDAELAEAAYLISDAMMRVRNKQDQETNLTVEEAFKL